MKTRPPLLRLARACSVAAVTVIFAGWPREHANAADVENGVIRNPWTIWKNGVAPAEFKFRYTPIGSVWRGVRPRRPIKSNDTPQAPESPATQPASPSGRVPGDGGFAGVNFKQEEPLVIDFSSWSSIAVGKHQRTVRQVLGEPNVKLPLKWFYPGDGWLAFDANGRVTEFSLPVRPASREPVRVHPAVWAKVQLGMTKAQVCAHLGEPEIKLVYKWFYGPDRWIAFDGNGVARDLGESKI